MRYQIGCATALVAVALSLFLFDRATGHVLSQAVNTLLMFAAVARMTRGRRRKNRKQKKEV